MMLYAKLWMAGSREKGEKFESKGRLTFRMGYMSPAHETKFCKLQVSHWLYRSRVSRLQPYLSKLQLLNRTPSACLRQSNTSRNMPSISFQVRSIGSYISAQHSSPSFRIISLIYVLSLATCQRPFPLSRSPPRENMYVRLTLVPASFDQSSCSCTGRTKFMDIIPLSSHLIPARWLKLRMWALGTVRNWTCRSLLARVSIIYG